jgi:hypothetical protein
MANYTLPNGSSGFSGYFGWGNTVTGGLLGPAILFLLWLIIFVFANTRDDDVVYAAAIASMVCFPVSMIMGLLGLITADAPLFLLILSGILIVLARRRRVIYT